MCTFFNISDIATDPPFWKVCYRFCTDYYGMLPRLGNIRRKPRVTRHNPSLTIIDIYEDGLKSFRPQHEDGSTRQ